MEEVETEETAGGVEEASLAAELASTEKKTKEKKTKEKKKKGVKEPRQISTLFVDIETFGEGELQQPFLLVCKQGDIYNDFWGLGCIADFVVWLEE